MEIKMSKALSKIVNVLTLKSQKKRSSRPTTEDDSYYETDNIAIESPKRRERTPLPPTPTSDIIGQLPYFHPQLHNKEDVQNFMSQYSLQDGYFVIRRSFKDPTSYIITVTHQSGLKHIKVMTIENRFSLKDKTFDTFDELMQFYSHREIPNKENVTGILLKFPIRRPIIDFGEYILVDESKGTKASNEIQPSESTRDLQDIGQTPESFGKRMSLTSQPSEDRTDGGSSSSSAQTPAIPPKTGRLRPQPPTSPKAANTDTCSCGLSSKESALPMGWSVHISQEEETKEQVFFLSPKQETHLELPMTVCLLLSPEQQEFIRNLQKDTVSKTWVSWSV